MKTDKRGVVTIPMESSIAPPIFFLIGAAAATIGAVVTVWGVSSESDIMAGVLPLLIGTPIALLSLHSWRAGPLRLVIDVPAGVIHHTRGSYRKSCGLDALGPLNVEKYTRRSEHRGQLREWWKLRAPGLDKELVNSPFESDATKLRDKLNALVARSAVRQVLATADPSHVVQQLEQRVPDPQLRRRALDDLVADHDAAIRDKATNLSAHLANV